ncbi:MAG TPA: hypothetical protein VK982_11950 [Bacteroidales bacterium]|nr:hypothetical protein [Bacteroidales bacterium]
MAARKKTFMQTLDDITGNRRMSLFVVWYCTPETERESWEKFASKNNNKNVSWEYAEKWLLDADIQSGIKYYMQLQHEQKMRNIYNKMYEQALEGDVNSAKFLVDFAKEWFKESKENELDKLLNGINLEDDKDE